MIVLNWLEISKFFFNKNIRATFSFKNINLDAPEFAKYCGFNHKLIAVPGQTHSNNVLKLSKGGFFPDTDGIFTFNSSIICSIQVADCLPIFFAHKTQQFFGIVHAGWRGLVGGIIEQSIDLIKKNNFSIKGIQVFVGPSIQSCCFEVREDIIKSFNSDFIKKINSKYFVNLQQIAINKLKLNGIFKENIMFSKDCTFCRINKYHSYRRDGKKTGRMIGLIGLES